MDKNLRKDDDREFLKSKELWVVGAVALALFLLTYFFAQEFSSFTAGILRSTIVVLFLVAVDKFLLKDISTINEIKNNNIAFGLLLMAIAIIIHAGFAAV
jgi:hypothetical protein